jgi:hypothetical protein
MTTCKLRDGRQATILGNGPLSGRFKQILINGETSTYLVWSDTMMYRLDGKENEKYQRNLDIVEVM